MATIAFLGLGMMGAPMAGRLRAAGHHVRAWNRTSEKATAWARDGGEPCATPAEAARGASEIHLMLSDDGAVETVLFGAEGALAGSAPSTLVVDHTTVSVAGTQERVARLRERGHPFLSAPVMGGPANMAAGEGLMYVAGPRATYDAAAATLRQLVERHWFVGERNAEASALKLMATSLLFAIVSALTEFFAIGASTGIAPEKAVQLFERFDPGIAFKNRAPRMARGDYAATFKLALAEKDARLALEAAGGPANAPMLATVHEKIARLVKAGHGELDLGGINVEIVPAAE